MSRIHNSQLVGIDSISVAHTDRVSELQDFFEAFQNLTAYGGGDYQEYALHAILKALQETDTVFGGEYLIPGSHAIVITDALSKCGRCLAEYVISEAQESGVCIHFFLSENPTLDGVYMNIANRTHGTVINSFEEWQLASFVASYQDNPCSYSSSVPLTVLSERRRERLGHILIPRATTNSHNFNVTHLAELLRLSFRADDGSTVTITRPDGTRSTRTVVSGSSALFTEHLPQQGRWTATVNRGTLDVTISQQITLDTTFVYKSDGLYGTVSTPPPACKIICRLKFLLVNIQISFSVAQSISQCNVSLSRS